MRTFRAPGRVNLIGEHTDHSGGLVMPVAIDRETRVSLTLAPGRLIRAESANLSEQFEFDAGDLTPAPRGDWTDYVRGVALMLARRGVPLSGARLVIASNVPLGAGLSSSAALEVAVAYALLAHAEEQLPPDEIALLCQRAENEFVGVQCGIMDQYAACCARQGQALVLDCGSMRSRYLRLPPRVRLVICNTMVRHELAASAYNERRSDCEEAARRLGVGVLSELSVPDLARRGPQLPEQLLKRARHVVTENARVRSAAAALEGGDLEALGEAMAGSHASLRDDYEVSCAELDLMVEIARDLPGVYGARMTGGGFGGCTVNLVHETGVDSFRDEVSKSYAAQTRITPEIYVCAAAAGAREVLDGA
jgi:galactokinase